MKKRELRIVVEITRNYGMHSVKFGLGEVVQIASGTQRREAFHNLLVQLDDQIGLYEETHLQGVNLPQAQTHVNTTSNVLEQIKVTHILVESKNGKRMVSAQGGKYAKHGVPIYDDSCETELPIETYDFGKHDVTMHNLTATIDMIDGKPTRCLSIR